MKRNLWASLALAAQVSCATLAPANPHHMGGAGCMEKDQLVIADVGLGEVEVWYANSACNSSEGFNEVVSSPSGVQMRVIIDINVDGNKELIWVIPMTDGYFAFPPKVEVLDGESAVVRVLAGMA